MTEAERRTLIRKAQGGDQKARDTLVEQNLGLVYKFARKFVGHGCEEEDLHQAGILGLLKAIDTFDLEKPWAFSTWSYQWIRHHLQQEQTQAHEPIIPRGAYTDKLAINRIEDEFLVRNARTPTDEEIAERMPVRETAVNEGIAKVKRLRHTVPPVRLDVPLPSGEEDTMTVGEATPDIHAVDPLDAVAQTMVRESVERALGYLSPEYREVVERKYGFNGYEPHTNQEIVDAMPQYASMNSILTAHKNATRQIAERFPALRTLVEA